MNKQEAKRLKRLKHWKKATLEEPLPTQETQIYSYANYKAYEKRVREHLKDLEPPYTFPTTTSEGGTTYFADSIEELAKFSWNALKQVKIDPTEVELTHQMKEYCKEEE
ncbi:MAG: hypothetical protein WA865_04080 [Spirulinaceae cyanobacterium]